MSERKNKPDKNRELMLAAGSKTGAYDIEAPDQWRFVMLHAKDPLERAFAWVKSKTTAFRHESPFCVDEHGRPLYIRHLAADMGWKEQTARNVLGELKKQGRIRLKGKRIWYCADIPQAYLEPAEGSVDQPDGEEEETVIDRRTRGERINSVRRYYGDYVADFISELPEKKQIECLDEHDRWRSTRRAIFADIMAAARMQIDPMEDSMFLRWGLPKKRLPKRRTAEVKWVQLNLLADINSVQEQKTPRTESPDQSVDARAVVQHSTAPREHAPSPTSNGVPSSSKVRSAKAPPASDQGPAGKSAAPAARAAYETPRDELIAIYKAKTGELPPYALIDRIETLLLKEGRNFESFLAILQPHLGNTWKTPPAFLTHKAKFGFDEAVPVAEPKLKLAPKCPRCLARGGRGAILQDGAIAPCPDCSTPEWIEELAAKEKRHTGRLATGAA